VRRSSGLIRSTSVVSSATLLSRITGFARDALIANYIPVQVSDAFYTAFKIPNILRRLLSEGALSAAFIPTFIRVNREEGPDEADALACSVGRLLFLTTIILTGLGCLAAPLIIKCMLPGWKNAALISLAIDLTRIMFPFVIFICMAGLAMGQLNSLGKFGIPALAPLIFNLSLISYLCFLPDYLSDSALVKGLGWAVVVGGFLQWGVQLPSLWRANFLRHLWGGLWHSRTRQILWLMGPAVLGMAGSQLALLINSIFASFLVYGSISALYYGNRVFQFPLGVVGIALSTAAFPRLAKQAGLNGNVNFSRELNHSLRMLFYIMIPSTMGLMVLSRPIIYGLYNRGEFMTRELFIPTVIALVFYSIGLVGHAGVKVLSSAFYSFNNTKTPVLVTLLCLAINILLTALLVFPLGLGHGGLALATSISALLNAGVLGYLFSRKVKSVWWEGLRRSFFNCASASLLMALIVYGSISLLMPMLPLNGTLNAVIHIAVGLAIGVSSYVALSRWLARDEYRNFMADLFQK
jgi:putative peptidoglycan lipid II flippase